MHDCQKNMTLFSYDLSLKVFFTLLIICRSSDFSSVFYLYYYFFCKKFRDLFHCFPYFRHYFCLHLSFYLFLLLRIFLILIHLFSFHSEASLVWKNSVQTNSCMKPCFLTQILDWLWNCFQEKEFIFICHRQDIYSSMSWT